METFQPGQPHYPREEVRGGDLERFRKLVGAFRKSQTVIWVFFILIGSVFMAQVLAMQAGVMVQGVIPGAMLILLGFALVAAVSAADVLEVNIALAVVVTLVASLVPGGALIYVWLLQGQLQDRLKEFGCEPGFRGLVRAKVVEVEARLAHSGAQDSPSVGS